MGQQRCKRCNRAELENPNAILRKEKSRMPFCRRTAVISLCTLLASGATVKGGCQGVQAFSAPVEIHRTIRQLREGRFYSDERYGATTHQVIEILKAWTLDVSMMEECRSLVNKANLFHEVEESIVALHYLQLWQNTTSVHSFISLDACCGKGVFSILLNYLSPMHFPKLSRIVLFDKDPKIDWTHIHQANRMCEQDNRPYMDLWEGTNLHDHDYLVTKLGGLGAPIAMTGIHLCKTLSPTLVGLANAVHAPYLCLAPCCLPRTSQVLQIAQFESPLQRQTRLKALQHRKDARARRTSKCYVCQGEHHVRDCPTRKQFANTNEWNEFVHQALLGQPCWNCGAVGHRCQGCPVKLEIPPLPRRPFNVSEYVALTPASGRSDNRFERYCRNLAEFVEDTYSCELVDSGLQSSHNNHSQHGHNWNKDKKSLFIVASRE